MQVSMMRLASERSELPTAANAPLPPKVIVPSVNVETFRPERPRVRHSMSGPRDFVLKRRAVEGAGKKRGDVEDKSSGLSLPHLSVPGIIRSVHVSRKGVT